MPNLKEYQDYLDGKPTPKAERIAFGILEDFTSRSGLEKVWDSIAMEVQEGILQAWVDIAEENIETTGISYPNND